MPLPGFSVLRQGPVRIGGTQSADFNLFEYMGGPSVAPPGTVEVILEKDFLSRCFTARVAATEDPFDSSTWAGAFRLGAWPAGTSIYLLVLPGAIIQGDGGVGGGSYGFSVGPLITGAGGGGQGRPGGLGGTGIAPVANGAAGSTVAPGAGTLNQVAATGDVIGDPATDASHGLILDDGIDLTLENYGTIWGAGGGGQGLNGLELDGFTGRFADQDGNYNIRGGTLGGIDGENGGWLCHNADIAAPVNPSPSITHVVPPAYPNNWGFEYKKGGFFGGDATSYDVVDGP